MQIHGITSTLCQFREIRRGFHHNRFGTPLGLNVNSDSECHESRCNQYLADTFIHCIYLFSMKSSIWDLLKPPMLFSPKKLGRCQRILIVRLGFGVTPEAQRLFSMRPKIAVHSSYEFS